MKGRLQSSSIRTRRSSGRTRAGHGTETWKVDRAVDELKRAGEKRNIEGMARFGIRAKKVLGVSKPRIDELARNIGRNHALALQLWKTGISDARILAGIIAEKDCESAGEMDRWKRELEDWDTCDG